jgi:hypothetical protein
MKRTHKSKSGPSGEIKDNEKGISNWKHLRMLDLPL